MEKYRAFTDPHTGLHPFLPQWADKRFRYFTPLLPIRLLICIIRLVLLLPISLLLYVTGHVIALPFGILLSSQLYKTFQSYTHFIGLRCILWSLGILYINEINNNKNNHLKQNKKNHQIILCNYTSCFEIIYLYMKLNPQFTITHNDGSISFVDFTTILKNSLSFEINRARGQFQSLNELNNFLNENKIKICVVIFPEMMKSNGLYQLEWKTNWFTHTHNNDKVFDSFDFIVISFNYFDRKKLSKNNKNVYFSPPHTVHTPFIYFLTMCYTFYHHMEVRKNVFYTGLFSKPKCAHININKMKEMLISMLPKGKDLCVNGEQLNNFYMFYNKTQKKGYTNNLYKKSK